MTDPSADPAKGRLFEIIVEKTSEGVWAIDAQSLTTYVNQSMADMLGYSRDELVGRSMFDLMEDEGRRVATANVERRKGGIAEVHEFVFRRKDGESLSVRLTTSVLHDEAGGYAGAFALATNLAETRHWNQERARLWQIVDDSLNEIYLFRADDLRFEYINRGALGNLGFTLEEMLKMSPLDIKPALSREALLALLAPLLDGRKEKVVFETVHRRRDGSTYPVEVHLQSASGSPRLLVAIINDVSERVEAERVTRATEARFRGLIEHSLDLLLLASADGRFTFASPSVLQTLGYTPEELLALEPFDIVHPDDRRVAEGALSASRAGQENGRTDFRVRHRDGSWRTLSFEASNQLDNPEINAFVLNARDVTNERKLEAQLQQSQRLESVGRLAGGVAHDFNNILTTILGCAAFLEEDRELSVSARDDVREIKRAGERASELTSQLLAFARQRIIRPQTLALGTVIANQERFLRRVIGEQIVLTSHYPADLWPIFVDPAQLEQVIVNLCVNARDAMKDGGRLTLEAQNVVLDASFTSMHDEVKQGPYVLLMISDSGEGIPADVLPHIFEPFFTTKPVSVGSGLGLASVYGIVRQSGGYVWVYSEPGVGTTFKIYFPRSQSHDVAAEDPATPALRRGSERVLVVEDEDSVRRMLVRALESAGYTVHAEATPAAGLAWARAQRGAFDLLVTDVVMPGMSGKQLATQITAEFPSVWVLFISGYTENTIVHRGVLEDGVEFLAKPFSLADVRARVREVLDRARRGERGPGSDR